MIHEVHKEIQKRENHEMYTIPSNNRGDRGIQAKEDRKGLGYTGLGHVEMEKPSLRRVHWSLEEAREMALQTLGKKDSSRGNSRWGVQSPKQAFGEAGGAGAPYEEVLVL